MTDTDDTARRPRQGSTLPEHIEAALRTQKQRVDAADARAASERATLDAMLARFHLDKGCSTEALGRVVGLTKQRVHQLAMKESAARKQH